MLAQAALAWLLTYLLHSTLLLGLAWLASKPLIEQKLGAQGMQVLFTVPAVLLIAALVLGINIAPVPQLLQLIRDGKIDGGYDPRREGVVLTLPR